MEQLKIHQDGKIDFLKALIEKYDEMRNKITKNDSLSDCKKESELKNINEKYENEKKAINHRLF